MPIDFPSSPTLNQSYSFGGLTWRWNDSGWVVVGGPNSSTPIARASAQVTISASAAATVTGNITLPRSCVLISIQLDRAAWLRLYSSAAAADSDSARARDTAPEQAAGVIADPVFTAASTMQLEGAITAINRESPATTTYPFRLTNDGSSGDVVVTITYLNLEP